jgi:hypothetical protein
MTINSEEVAMLAKKFRKFLRFKNRNNKNSSLDISKGDFQGAAQGKKEKPKKDKNAQSIQCNGCSGFGHVRTDCPNFKNSKEKAMNATLSNDSGDSE